MEFLNRIQPLLCHDPQYVKVVITNHSQTALQCQYCQKLLPVYAYVDHVAEQDANEACRLAEMYCAWTGDQGIPVRFPLIGIDGLLPKVIENQTLGRISNSVQLLKWLNAPFTKDAVVTNIDSIQIKDLLDSCMEKMKVSEREETTSENTSEFKIMSNLLDALEWNFTEKEQKSFELYINKYVPFVKSCKDDDTLWLPPDDTTCSKPLIGQLQEQLLRSQAIRKLYSMYCFSFDVLHVLVGCYSCSSDVNVIQNWLLDFVIRVCRGQFFWKQFESNLQIQHLLNVLKKEVTYKRHTDLYYLIKRIRDGEGIECLSENLLKYSQLEKLLSEKNPEMVMCFQFPNVLFDNHYEQLAFNISLVVLYYYVNPLTGQIQKGTFAKIRLLSNLVKKVVQQLHEFDQRVNLPWTDSTFQLFLASSKELGEQMTTVLKILSPPKPQKNGEMK